MKSLTTTKAKIAYSVLFAFTLALLLSDASLDFSDGDNMLFHNGPIVTMDRDHPNPEAVYIENGIIKSIGKPPIHIGWSRWPTTQQSIRFQGPKIPLSNL